MSTNAVRWARSQPTGGPAERAALLILALESNHHGLCTLSAREIANELDTDRVTARRIVDRLRRRGLVSWDQGSSGERNTYRLTLSDLPTEVGGVATH